MFGTVTEKFTETGFGAISSATAGGTVRFSRASLMPDNSPDVGDHVDFELGTLDGVPQAVNVKLVTKAGIGTRASGVAHAATTSKARESTDPQVFTSLFTDLHRGHKSAPPPLKAPPPQVDQAPKQRQQPSERSLHSGKTECGSCGKLMVPRLNVYRGNPERSFCPFCGSVHRNFIKPPSKTKPSVISKIGGLVGLAAFELAVGGVITFLYIVFR